MKYYSIDFDYENYPNGSAIDRTGGELRENDEIKEIFWSHFRTRITVGFPKAIPKFHYINYRKSKKFQAEDFLDDLFSFGMLISDKMKKIIEGSYLPNHLFVPATIKFNEIYYDNYWFFCLVEANLNAINYQNSYFFIDDGMADVTPFNEYGKYGQKLVKFESKENLYEEMYKNDFPLHAYHINILEEKHYDIINLGVLIRPRLLFSEKVVSLIQQEKLTNCVFKEYLLVNQ